MYKTFVPFHLADSDPYGSFQTLGNLILDYVFPENDQEVEAVQNYRRTLDLSRATASTLFTQGDVDYIRDYFVSRTGNVMIIRIGTEQKEPQQAISFSAILQRPEQAHVYSMENSLVIEGTLDSGISEQEGMKYYTKMQIITDGGTVTINEDHIQVKEANEAIIYLTAMTNYMNDNYQEDAERLLKTARKANYFDLLSDHIKSYQEFYNRVRLSIGSSRSPKPQLPDRTTDQRILSFRDDDDPALATLYYNFGRYLLISSTRPHSLPPNLQGLWANGCRTPWNEDYHLNINVQMNHWPVEPGNLSELHTPLIELTKGLVQSGELTAKVFYGEDAQGWVAHMMTNTWNFTAPGDHSSWGATNTGGAWLCAHLWEHYLYTGDIDYLKEIYPVLKGAADFFLSTLIEEPAHGWLVTAPSSSPENSFYVGNDPTPVSVCMGPTMDIQLLKELFTHVIEAGHILGTDEAFGRELAIAYDRLPPHQISKEGYLIEWLEDYKEVDIHHRHISHLYGLYPGNLITPTRTPELAEACRVTLNRRGDEGTGWSRAWKINFWARLGDGNRAYKLFKSLLTPTFEAHDRNYQGGGTYPNLFCAHPPFQIDGNFGGTAGISEMLLQSHEGFIYFLPALPDLWDQGTLEGFKVRGGGVVNLQWSEGRARKASVTATFDQTFRIKRPTRCNKITVRMKKDAQDYREEYIEIALKNGEKATLLFE